MQTLRMREEYLPRLVEGLRSWGIVYAPVERGHGAYSLEPIRDPAEARPQALRTILPFKKLLLRPRFTMIEAENGGAPRAGTDNAPHPKVFFGAHACDVHALRILDLLHLTGYIDPYYKANRDVLTVVGYGCMPDEKCFCHSMDTSNADDGFDLFLTPLEGRYLVTVPSARGDSIVTIHDELFEPATREDTREYLERARRRERSFTLSLDVHDLPYILELKKDDPVWDELGRKCLCCGSCSMVCPTCACFNVADEIGEGHRCARIRTWDSCLYPDYARVAGGHNFREQRADRVRNRYYHKQEAFVREYGVPSCVGCGRCIESCPTGINVVEVFRHVRGEL